MSVKSFITLGSEGFTIKKIYSRNKFCDVVSWSVCLFNTSTFASMTRAYEDKAFYGTGILILFANIFD
jgi:hypothetical protein